MKMKNEEEEEEEKHLVELCDNDHFYRNDSLILESHHAKRFSKDI